MKNRKTLLLKRRRNTILRQFLFFSTVLFITSIGTWIMADIMWHGGIRMVEIFMVILFVPLFGMVSFGFTQALFGFIILLFRKDPFLLSNICEDDPAPDIADFPATAITVPIYNEDVTRVYEGIRAIYLSIAKTGALAKFDFFILSDSSDPNKWIEEEIGWIELCKQLNGFGKIFFRKRYVPLNSKSGNISDFCRRWGRKYRYMVIMDADSVMEGATLVNLVRLMEKNPTAGIIQTVPVAVQSEVFYSRMQQFAGTLYGPIFQAGLNFWMGDNGNYWGHNAIIRVAPFIEHCSLPSLPEMVQKKNLRFMSHDYVEAALMARANYEVWLAYDFDGSYENLPPTLIDSAKRDKRWCRGNMQHSWMLCAEGLHPINRIHLLLGIMSYLCSPLWLVFILSGIYKFYTETCIGRSYDFDVGVSAFLDNICGGRQSLALFIFTMSMLILPKIMSIFITAFIKPTSRSFGGFSRMVASVISEIVISVVTAPICMLFNASFVVQILMGINVPWHAQRRTAEGADWQEVIMTHWTHTAFGALLAFLSWKINPVLFYWLIPIHLGLLLSIPTSIILGSKRLGQSLRKAGFFLTPQETSVPQTVAHIERNLKTMESQRPPAEMECPDWGLLQVTIDPYVNAIHVSLIREKRRIHHKVSDYLLKLEDRFLKEGPSSLTRREQMALLMNAQAMTDIHHKVWTMPEKELAQWWQVFMKYYNTLSIKPSTPLYR